MVGMNDRYYSQVPRAGKGARAGTGFSRGISKFCGIIFSEGGSGSTVGNRARHHIQRFLLLKSNPIRDELNQVPDPKK